MADETRTILLELNIDSVKAIKNQKELKEIQKAVNKEFQEAKIGTEEYKKLETVSGLLTKRISGLKDATKQATSELNVQKGSTRDLQAQYNQLAKALRETTPGNEVLGQSFEEARKKALSLKTEIKDFNKSLGDDTGNVGNYGDAFKDAVGGINVFGQSLGGLFKMILTNPVGIIISALVGLFNILKQNDTIATFFKGTMTGIGIVFDQVSAVISDVVLGFGKFSGEASKVGAVVKDVGTRILNNLLAPINYLIDLMPAVNAALEGEFAKAADIAGDASVQFGKSMVFLNDEVPKFVSNIGDAVKVGVEYEAALDAIEEKQSKLNVTEAELSNQRDKLLLQSKDLSKTEEERISLLEKAEDIDKKLLAERLKLINEEIAVQQKYSDNLGKGSDKQEEIEFKINDLRVKRLAAENESLKFQEKARNKSNALIEKQIANEERLAEAQKKRQEENRKKNEDQLKRDVDATFKLEQFRRDQLAKNAKDIDEKLKAELKAEDFRVSVLLRNENLLASEREFILADSAARIATIHENSTNNEISLAKKAADEKKNLLNKQVNDISNNASLASGIYQNITQARLNNETNAIEAQRARDLKNAGNNVKKQEKINKEYDAKRKALEKNAAERQRDIQAGMALVNTFTGVTKVIAEYPKFDFGVATAIGVGLTIASGLAQVASIKSQKFAKGGYTGIGSGMPDESGYRPVGIVHENEYVVPERVLRTSIGSTLVNRLEGIRNNGFAKGGYTGFADGGFAARGMSQPVVNDIESTNIMLEAISRINFPPVTVEDINAGVSNRIKVVSGANV